jgi:O-antigen ligase
LIAALIVVAGIVVAGGLYEGGQGLERNIGQRFLSAFTPAGWGSRPHIWQDTLSLVSSRPLFGYGPDNFGLVYPYFQGGKWEVAGSGFELQIDKAHAEMLQVAATQGLVGLAAYLVVLGAFVRSFWRSRRDNLAVALFAGWAGYQVTVQLNFTALGAAFPFWVMAAAAVEIWEHPTAHAAIPIPSIRGLRVAIGTMSALALSAVAVAGVGFPFVSDYKLREAVDADFAGRAAMASFSAAMARTLAPFESVYAVEVGNIAFERGDWAPARSAYRSAADLGTYNPRVFRNLALADRNLGLTDEALTAAQQAVVLDRFDPANQALLDQLVAKKP